MLTRDYEEYKDLTKVTMLNDTSTVLPMDTSTVLPMEDSTECYFAVLKSKLQMNLFETERKAHHMRYYNASFILHNCSLNISHLLDQVRNRVEMFRKLEISA